VASGTPASWNNVTVLSSLPQAVSAAEIAVNAASGKTHITKEEERTKLGIHQLYHRPWTDADRC
jgi:hypothetical protein